MGAMVAADDADDRVDCGGMGRNLTVGRGRWQGGRGAHWDGKVSPRALRTEDKSVRGGKLKKGEFWGWRRVWFDT